MADRVIFRSWRSGVCKGEILAVFPDLSEHGGGCDVTCYAHVGQHGSGDYQTIMDRTRPATEAEYADLLRELAQIGYTVRMVQRRSWGTARRKP